MPSFCIKKCSVSLKTYSIELQMMGRGKFIAAGLQIVRRGETRKMMRMMQDKGAMMKMMKNMPKMPGMK